MTKADIVDRVFEKVGMTKRESSEVVEELFALIKDTLESGEKIKVAGFGNFEVKKKSDRRGRNPQTGEDITIEARRILTFKPSALTEVKEITLPISSPIGKRLHRLHQDDHQPGGGHHQRCQGRKEGCGWLWI